MSHYIALIHKDHDQNSLWRLVFLTFLGILGGDTIDEALKNAPTLSLYAVGLGRLAATTNCSRHGRCAKD